VEPAVLETVRADLVEEPDPPPLVVEVEEDAALGAPDHREGGAQLVAAVAAQRAEHVAGEALGVEADEDGFGPVERASCVRDDLARRPRVLLERMTDDVARTLLEKFAQITEVQVRVEKPKPDGLEALAEAVELTIAREPRS